MNKLKKILLILLVIAMILPSNIIPSYASTPPEGSEEYLRQLYRLTRTPETMNAYLQSATTSFEDASDAENYMEMNFSEVYPTRNRLGWELNFDALKSTGMTFYGNHASITGNTRTGTEYLSLGQTFEGRPYSNMAHPEAEMPSPTIVQQRDYSTINPMFPTFISEWNDPRIVGRRFLPGGTEDEQLQHGERMLKLWMENIINRTPEVYPYSPQRSKTVPTENRGRPFKDVLTYDQMIVRFQVTAPPTPMSYGTAVAWFRSGGIDRHRTYFIDKIPKVDLIAKEMTYNEDTKILTLNYDVKGYEVMDRTSDQLIWLRRENEPFTGKIIGMRDDATARNIVLTEISGTRNNIASSVTFNTLTHNGYNSSGQVQYNLSDILEDFLTEDIDVYVAMNASPKTLIKEDNFNNNSRRITIPKSQADIAMKSMTANINKTTNRLEVTGIVNMLRGPATVPYTEVALRYTLEDGTTGGDLVSINNLAVRTDTPVSFNVTLPAGVNKLDVRLEVNPGKNLMSAAGVGLPESNYANNILSRSLGKGFDLSIKPSRNYTMINQGSPTSVELNIALADASAPINTNVILYNSTGTQISTNPISMTNGVSGLSNFNLGVLPLGEHTFYGVVNSNFNLTNKR